MRTLLLAGAALALAGAQAAASPMLRMPAQDNRLLLEEAYILDESGTYRYAEPIPTQISPKTHGEWTFENGMAIWTLEVESPQARNLNFGFTTYWMPEGGQLMVYSEDGRHYVGPFTDDDNKSHRQLWTPMVFGESATIEVILPEDSARLLELELTSVNHGFRNPGEPSRERSGSCNVDVICPEGDDYRDIINANGVISTGGSTFCSGSLLNNTRFDGTPLFLTAAHCGINANNAASLVVYWKFENSFCRPVGVPAGGGVGDGTLNLFNTGSFFRARSTASDFVLVELDSPVPEAAEPFYAGWDATGAEAEWSIAIHHPATNEKRISFDFDPTTTTNYLQSAINPNGTHARVANWEIGTTEPGSSGSPLYNQNKQVIGQLHGGYAACSNNLDDWYGRISVSWEGGGTPATRLRDWLDPDNTGLLAIDGFGGSPFQKDGDPIVDDSQGTGDGDGVIEPGESPILLSFPIINQGPDTQEGITATLTSETPGVQVLVGASTYPDMGPGASALNATPFSIAVGPEVACGSPITLRLEVESSTTGGPLAYALPTGPVCDILADFRAFGEPVVDDSLGNGSGVPEPGDTLAIRLAVSNVGASATNIVGTLSSSTPGITVLQAVSSFPDIAIDGNGESIGEFLVQVSSAFPCGGIIGLDLALDSDQGGSSVSYAIQTGINFASDEPLVLAATPGTQIGPNAGTSTSATLSTDEFGIVTGVRVFIDLTHTWMGDLSILLTAPNGQEVLLFNRRGGSADNMRNTTFDDNADQPITAGAPPYGGSFRPEEPLSILNGIDVAGDWIVTITDNANQDGGVFIETRVIIDYEEYRCGDAPTIVAGGATVVDDSEGNGNDNGYPDPGEMLVHLYHPVLNQGFACTEAYGVLSTTDPQIRILADESVYPDLSNGDNAVNATPFTIAVSPERPCGVPIPMSILFTCAGGSSTILDFELESPAGTATESDSASVEPGATFGAAAVSVPLAIAHAGDASDLAVTVQIAHAAPEEVRLELVHPSGASVLLMEGLGAGGTNIGPTTFTDSAAAAIASGTAPFAGEFRPAQPLSALAGLPAAGDWLLVATDTLPRNGVNGTVLAASLLVSVEVPACPAVDQPVLAMTDMDSAEPLLDGSVIDFGNSSDGAPIQKTLRISNPGAAPFVPGGAIVSGAFSIQGGMPSSIAPGAHADIVLVFTPDAGRSAAQEYTGTFSFSTNLWEPQEVTLGLVGTTGADTSVPAWDQFGY